MSAPTATTSLWLLLSTQTHCSVRREEAGEAKIGHPSGSDRCRRLFKSRQLQRLSSSLEIITTNVFHASLSWSFLLCKAPWSRERRPAATPSATSLDTKHSHRTYKCLQRALSFSALCTDLFGAKR